MYRKLRKHLTFLYTLITGLILTVLLFICFLYMYRSVQSKNEAIFSSHFLNISAKFQSESSFSDQWLAQTEANDKLIIHIEENGTPLFFKGAWISKTPRGQLLSHALKISERHSVFPKSTPISFSTIQSPLFTFSGSFGDHYTGKTMVMRTKNGYKSLILLQDTTESHRQVYRQFLLFLALDLLGIFFFALTSWIFVGKSIHPLKENQQKQTAFLVAASHELRTPVAVIQASASAILEAPKRSSQMVHTIEQECKRMSHLISDLLFLASSDSGRYSINMTKQDADTLLLDAYEMFEPLYLERRIKLRLSLPEKELPPVFCDRDRILQVLSILLDNAMTYAPPETSVTLTSAYKGGIFSFSVIDHGPGIPNEQKQHVFDRFYQADPSRKNSNHFGLGLSIAAELIHLHGGRLLLTDTQDGGCTFTVRLKLPPS